MAIQPPPSGRTRSPDAARLLATLAQPRPHERLERGPQGICLEVVSGADEGARFTFDATVVTGGRGAGHDIVLSDDSVSLSHFELSVGPAGLQLRDLGSRNGTWVGRGRLVGHGTVELYEDSSFWAGNERLRVVSVPEGDVAVSERDHLGRLYGSSLEMRKLFALLERLAPTPVEVLLTGETGTGKEVVARTLHELSGRKGEFIALDCGSIPATLAESMILGHVRGAFTGATHDNPGCFEAADGGTLFLDEIGELPLDLQPKLLRVLEEREVTRLGEHRTRKVDVRIIAATNRELPTRVASGEFRQDLFQRIATMRLVIPPLRQRPDDIPTLARHFIAQFAAQTGHHIELTDDAADALKRSHWLDGNVRQLKGVLRRTAYLVTGDTITAEDLRSFGAEWDARAESTEPDASLLDLSLKEAGARLLRDFQHRYCIALLDRFGDDLNAAAAHAGYTKRGLCEILQRLDLGDDTDGP